ncbi:MAG: class I SAM-dependent methyltransferase [Chloroflexota bacterium]|nr:class I SAM-dependent methyltransferase [Chloroflexota bacterium]
MSEGRYAFGDSEIAAARLRLAANVFQPEMERLIGRAPSRPGSAYDLGCGPGHTTRIVAGTARPGRTVGLDTSKRFIEMARAQPMAGVEYLEHDVTLTPFPCGPADLLFSHFLLSHLPDPRTALTAWMSQLRPSGLLLLDEVSDIWTTHPVFMRYLEMVERVVDAAGGQLYAGKTMERAVADSAGDIVSSELVEHPVSTAQAAAMFRLNLAVWRETPTAQAIVPAASIAEIACELDGLAESSSDHEIVWGMRQVICRAAPAA